MSDEIKLHEWEENGRSYSVDSDLGVVCGSDPMLNLSSISERVAVRELLRLANALRAKERDNQNLATEAANLAASNAQLIGRAEKAERELAEAKNRAKG